MQKGGTEKKNETKKKRGEKGKQPCGCRHSLFLDRHSLLFLEVVTLAAIFRDHHSLVLEIVTRCYFKRSSHLLFLDRHLLLFLEVVTLAVFKRSSLAIFRDSHSLLSLEIVTH